MYSVAPKRRHVGSREDGVERSQPEVELVVLTEIGELYVDGSRVGSAAESPAGVQDEYDVLLHISHLVSIIVLRLKL